MTHRGRPAVLTWLAVAVLAFGAAGCGGDEGADEAATTSAPATTEAAPETTGGGGAAGDAIVIGWAFDGNGAMAPFDGPALAAAKLRVEALNAEGGVDGRPLELATCDTQGNKPAPAKACATRLLGQRDADIVFVTCDVDFAAPVVQEAINRGVLAIAPCIGTDQMGPKRFGEKGRLAFSFGNVAQDEGAAMAELAWDRGWKRAAIATDTVIVYFKDVTAAFEERFTELGGEIVAEESYQSLGANNVQNAVSRLANVEADVIVTSTAGAFGALSQLLSGLRSLGNETPVLNSWAGDGTYWLPKQPRVSQYYFVTYASAFGDDPNDEVRALIDELTAQGAPPATGGFLGGAGAIDGVAEAIRRAGSTDGEALAAELEQFEDVETISGSVNFSPELHTVFGREYRVMEIQDNEPRFLELVQAESPAGS